MVKNIRSIVIIMVILLISAIPAYAHKMTIEPVEDGVIKVHYDDGSFSSRTVVTVYDSNGEELESGKLDEEGKYTYDKDKDVSYIVAEDGLGHKDEWKVGEEVKADSGGSKTLKIVGVVAVLAIVGIVSYKKKGKVA
ncbi:hypothetical protein ACTNDY_03395 [Tissierellaceae bacterium HCP3S3_D8]